MARGYRTLKLEDFSGGWNPRDAPSQVADNESPDMLNMTLDERGGVVKRLGYSKYNSSQLGSDAIENIFYWQTGRYLIAQQGTTLYYSDGGGTWTTTTKSFTTSARVGLCDFQGKIVAVHPVDGVFIGSGSPPTTWSQTSGGTNNMEAVRGNAIAVWQNKVWVGGDPNNKPRVWFSAAGDPTTWTIATSFVDVREKDDALVTAMGAGEGMDVTGRPGLFVFKAESCYRINNSTNGSYTTVDNQYGAASPLAITSAVGVTAALSHKGIILLHGQGEDAELVSDKLRPLFSRDQLALAQTANMCAGSTGDRMYFSLTRFGATSNNLTLEFDPVQGWIVPHSFGAACFATYAKDDLRLIHCAPTAGYAYYTFTGGTDDGADISCRWQSRWYEPARGHTCRFRKMVSSGRGAFNLYVKYDYDSGPGTLNQVTDPFVPGVWDTSLWDNAFWGFDQLQVYQKFYSLGFGRAISFEIQETSSTSGTAPKLLDDGQAASVGAIAMYGLTVDFVDLGAS